jgi:uncharacterized protein
LEVDTDVIIIGALLHDIGRSVSQEIDHGIIGCRILRSIGLPEEVSVIAESHVGSGIPRDEAIKLGLPEKDYAPQTLEEKIVCLADKVSGSEGVIPFLEIRNKYINDMGEGSMQVKRLISLFKELYCVIRVSNLSQVILYGIEK